MTAIPTSATTLGLMFRHIRDAMWARMERELQAAGHELTFSQYIVLKRLATGSAGVTDLARAAELNPGAMTRLLDKLEARGLLARSADPNDRRAIQLAITPEGEAQIEPLAQALDTACEAVMGPLDETERRTLLRLLTRLIERDADA